MQILLINDNGETVARLDDVEKYDGTRPGHAAGLLDLLEVVIATARSSGDSAQAQAGRTARAVQHWVSPK